MENKLLCVCGHRRDKHAVELESVDSFPCYECLGLYLDDRSTNVPLKDVHRLCGNFKMDNLSFLEEQYERLSKRIR